MKNQKSEFINNTNTSDEQISIINKIYDNRNTILVALINLTSIIFLTIGIIFVSFTEALVKEGLHIIVYTVTTNFITITLLNKTIISNRIKKIANYFKTI